MSTVWVLQKHQRAQEALEALPPQRELVSATQDLQVRVQQGGQRVALGLLLLGLRSDRQHCRLLHPMPSC